MDDVSLKEYFEAIINTNDKRYEQKFNDTKIAVDAALAAADRAVTKAEIAAEKRFESVNEFRNTLSDQQRNLMPRSEAEIQFKGLNEKFDSLNLQSVSKEGQGVGIKEAIAYFFAIVGILTGLSRFIK